MEDQKVGNHFQHRAGKGQALVEYALILVLVGIAFGFALAATGPVIGNVFSNTVYNLLGQTPEAREIARPGDFWLTVTWVAGAPLEERALPTRTDAPPSSTPTDGPSPTASPVTPSRTPRPTDTPPPTATPSDFEFNAPYLDTVDTPKHWRIGAEPFLGSADWKGEYFVNQPNNSQWSYDVSGTRYAALDYAGGSPSFIKWNREFGPEFQNKLDFNWQNGGPAENWPSSDYNHFSVRYTREIFIDAAQPVKINFVADSDDGIRVWLLRKGVDTAATCSLSSTGVRSGSPPSGTRTFDDPSTDCLLIDDWNLQGMGNPNRVTRTLEARVEYILQVDVFEATGGAGVRFGAGISSNPDDTLVDNSGNPLGGGASCEWVQYQYVSYPHQQSANSLDFMWKEYPGNWNTFPTNMRCHLELRGSVYIPQPGDESLGLTPMARPEFVFWDIWDFQTSNQTGWLEIAEYKEDPLVEGKVDRANLQWIRLDLHQGATRNYNWTRNVIDLTDVRRDGATTTDDNFIGKRVTFRFVMQNLNSTSERRWYIDDIEVREGDGAGNEYVPGTLLTLNDPDSADDFITSGHWELTSTKTIPDLDHIDVNPDSCCSWELLPSGQYATFYSAGNSADYGDGYGTNSRALPRLRVHYVELNGWVNVDPALADDEGDTGAPMLSFYHAFYVGRYTGLEVQYKAAGDTQWKVVPGTVATAPYGRIRDVTQSSNDSPHNGNQQALQKVDMLLSEIKDGGGNPITRFRLRFAMLVAQDADRRGTPSGWWIDQIYVHRQDRPKFLDYPFFDSGEIGVKNWLPSGQWYRTTESSKTGDHAFTDSPFSDYGTGDSALRFSWPIDFLNDTPDNLSLTNRNDGTGANGCSTAPPAPGGNCGGAAVDPIMSFWWWRRLGGGDNFYLEWRRANETDSDWKPLWTYIDRMYTVPRNNQSKTREGVAWEHVEIDLSPVLRTFTTATNPSDYQDDDILFRFRFLANSTGYSDGVYIDDIWIGERPPERVHRLWPTTENRAVAYSGGTPTLTANGSGATFVADGEEANWYEKWRIGGDWQDIQWDQHNGLRAFHESATGQDAPPPFGSNLVATRHDTHSVLELVDIIDLRATEAIEKPTLYFWSHYYVGDDDRISVQISEELNLSEAAKDSDMNTRCSGTAPQCYEQIRGWGPWLSTTTTSQWPWTLGEWSRTYTWQRFQIDLTQYAKPNNTTAGKRIRIRFVYDGYDTDNNVDGWYLDNISIGPRQDNVIRSVASTAFADPARNLSNWVAEGLWGLDPELTRGGGGPATLGTWRETFWNCGSCESLAPGGTSSSNKYKVGADRFLDSNGSLIPSVTPVTRTVLDINYDIRSGSPRPGLVPTDRFVGRWVLDTPVVGPTSGVRPGDYSFITISDDGVRMKYQILQPDGTTRIVDPVSGQPLSPQPGSQTDSEEWNMIYNWTDHGRIGDMGLMRLADGYRYRITLEWYEKTRDAVLILTIGGSSFSFTDSPKQGAGAAFPDIGSWPRSNSSLILKGTLDLAGTTNPVLQYYTYYEVLGTARVEVSINGGFTWTSSGLSNSITYPSGVVENFNSATYGNTDWMPNDGDWALRRHNLTSYVGEKIMIRFRLDNTGRDGINENRDSNNNYYTSWWVTDIRVSN